PRRLLGRLQGLFLSDEDVLGQEAQMLEWLQRLPVGIVTAGEAGALLYVNGERYEIRPRPAREVDPTGAGDVFAAAFLIGYQFDGDPWQAAADRKSTRLNSSHGSISYAVFCLKKKKI